jgi:hypothetical protein
MPLLSPFQVEEARKIIAAGKLRREVAELLISGRCWGPTVAG